MSVAAERRGQVTVGRDRRITRAGMFLRHYKLDELPLLINVLSGAMSLVGPRPEVPRHVAHYPPEIAAIVLSVRPGIFDLASVMLKNESAILGSAANPDQVYVEEILPAKLEHNRHYVRDRTFMTDLRIIFATIAAIFI